MREKRLVSWREYLEIKGLQAAFGSAGYIMALAGLMGFITALVTLPAALLMALLLAPESAWLALGLSLCFGLAVSLFGGICYGVMRAGGALLQASESVGPLQPVTRAQLQEFPAEQMLLRSTERPTSDETDLLRATCVNGAMEPELLLRSCAAPLRQPGNE